MHRSILALIAVAAPGVLHGQPRALQPIAARPTPAFAPTTTRPAPVALDSVAHGSAGRPFLRFALVGAAVGAVAGAGFAFSMCDGACDDAAPALGGAVVGAGVGALTGVALAITHDGAKLRRLPAR